MKEIEERRYWGAAVSVRLEQLRAIEKNIDWRYKCVGGHDACSTIYPSPACPYCEKE